MDENREITKSNTNARSSTKMSEMWDKRYNSDEYFYGTQPNEFLRKSLENLKPGKILFIGEGEGRNSVFAAKLGWEVDAVDFSEAGKMKAEQLAKENGVNINYIISDLQEFIPRDNYYDAIVNIFVHMPPATRQEVNRRLIQSLKKGGKVILEVYEKDQLKNSTGGPKKEELLYSLADIAEDFIDLEFELFEKKTIDVNEGSGHTGEAVVIRFIGVK